MNKWFSSILFGLVASLSFQSHGIVNGHEYQFEEQGKAEIFRELANELRCPKCQNQNLADSNAMIADDLRRELYQQVQEGKGSQEIVDFMVNRYGEFVLYRPKVNAMTYVLWYGPAALCVIAAFVFAMVMRQRKRKVADDSVSNQVTRELDSKVESEDEGFSETEKARLQSLLSEDTDSKEGK